MVSFVPVDPASIDTSRLGRRGRVSYPLLKSFLETNVKMAEVKMDGLTKNPAYLRSVLTAYINSKHLPIKIFQSGGVMYMMRLDLQNDGSPDPSYKPGGEKATEGAGGLEADLVAKPIDDQEVDERFHTEAPQVTK